MPFTFKLSKRLARMKSWIAPAAVAALTACELPDRTATGVTLPSVVQIVTTPDTVTIDPQQTRQFFAYGRTQAGDSVAVAVRWSSSGGTITSDGLYTADTVVGEYDVTATATDAPLTASSRVKNRGPMAELVLLPATASVLTGGTVPFFAYGRRKNGDSVAVNVVYSATGGGISATGLYTAGPVAGVYAAVATLGGATLADTAPVTISSAPVASVTVSPASASVVVGGTQQFTATTKDASGNVLTGRTVAWTSSAPLLATVSGTGLVTAVGAGTATITATSEGQSGSAALTVAAAPPPPPPPPPGAWPNEPSGFTVVEETGWEAGTLGNWYRIFQSADKPITVENVGDSPLGEAKVLQIGYAAGHVGGGGTELRYDIPSASRRGEIFVGYYVQVNAQWQGHSSAINKMVYLHDDTDQFAAMWYEIFGSGSNPLDLYVVNQSGSGPAGIRENVNQITFQRGRWHKVEIYQKQGTPGIVRVWVDGVLAIDRADVYTRTSPVNNITISGIWGGVGDSKNQFDFMRFDRIRISVP